MSNETAYTLVPSTNRGRYALSTLDGLEGPDLTSGQPVSLLLGGYWIDGRIEYGSLLYVLQRTRQLESGYYFLALSGTICGLCTGMSVCLR